MSGADRLKIETEIHDLRSRLKELESKLDDLEKDIKSEFNHNLEKVEWVHQTYDRRISLTEKVVFGAVSIILITVMGALLAKVII
jgi:cell division protein FtsL